MVASDNADLVSVDFHDQLQTYLEYVRGYVAVNVLQGLIDTGLLEDLREPFICAEKIASHHHLNREVVQAVLDFLVVEGLLERQENRLVVTPRLHLLEEIRGWISLFQSGYGDILKNIPLAMRIGPIPDLRNSAQVGQASCLISHFDSIPMVRRLLRYYGSRAKRFVDLGCGSAQYLIELCNEFPQMKGIGVEPKPEICEIAREAVAGSSLADRVLIVSSDAVSFLASHKWMPGDVVFFCFVLHEILASIGRTALEELLTGLGRVCQELLLIVVEVDRDAHEAIMRTPHGRGYYNGYFLLHQLTKQRLESRNFWRDIFDSAGFEIIEEIEVDPLVDTTGLEVAYALEPRPDQARLRSKVPISFRPNAKPSSLVADVAPPSMVESLARWSRSQRQDVVDFAEAVPVMSPPMSLHFSGAFDTYGDTRGMIELRRRIADRENLKYYTHLSNENVLITNGATEAISLAICHLVRPGDVVLLQAPAPEFIPKLVERMKGQLFALPHSASELYQGKDWAVLIRRVRPKVVIIHEPSNPGGEILGASSVSPVLTACEYCNSTLILDQVYDEFLFKGSPQWDQASAIRTGTIIKVNSVSKSYAAPGVRLGWLVSSSRTTNALCNLAEYWRISVSLAAQRAALALFEHDNRVDVKWVEQKMQTAVDMLREISKGIFCVSPPSGGLCLWVAIESDRINSGNLHKAALKAGVTIMPGTAFWHGDDQHFRICFARENDILYRGMAALRAAVGSLQQ